jgi:predicted nucleotidyltransferase
MVAFPEITKSRLRRELLSYFFTNLRAELYLREVAVLLKEDAGNLSKELAMLENLGIFTSRLSGKQKYFSLNRQYPLYKELKSVVFKTIGIEGSLKELLAKIDGLKVAFIYGSFAERKENSLSDIDLFLIGSPDEDGLMGKIDSLQKRLGREINYNVYPEREFKEKIRRKDSFVVNLIKRPKIFLKGNLDGI